MKNHVQIVAVLHIAFGVMSLFAAMIIFLLLALASGIAISQGEQAAGGIVAIVAVALAALLTVLGLPGIIGGWALYSGRPWGRPVILVLGILALPSIPFGTALGIYTLWTLLQKPESPVVGV